MKEKENQNNFVVIEYQILFDKRLNNTDKILYSIIMGISNKKGYSIARINYYCELLGKKRRAIFYSLKNLKDFNYIKVDKIGNNIKITPTIFDFIKNRQNTKVEIKEIFDYDWLNE